jgi:hypothetical protein
MRLFPLCHAAMDPLNMENIEVIIMARMAMATSNSTSVKPFVFFC